MAVIVDWTADELSESTRLSAISHKTGLLGYVHRISESLSSWFVLLFTAISTGIISALLDVAIDWLADIRQGHCSISLFYSFKACCPQKHMCEEWLSHTQSTNAFVSFLIYSFSAILMAVAAATIVTKIAPLCVTNTETNKV